MLTKVTLPLENFDGMIATTRFVNSIGYTRLTEESMELHRIRMAYPDTTFHEVDPAEVPVDMMPIKPSGPVQMIPPPQSAQEPLQSSSPLLPLGEKKTKPVLEDDDDDDDDEDDDDLEDENEVAPPQTIEREEDDPFLKDLPETDMHPKARERIEARNRTGKQTTASKA